ncbi:MAG TPA: type II secretion system F family protein [Candidatus Nanopelagicales bacterium]|nr:type II secretion system F family protein [Candidatus Nanopelagicales bacterium]
MGALVGLGAGLGILFIIGHLFQGRAAHRSRPRRSGRLQALVHAAAIPRLTPAGLIGACVGSAFVIGSLALIVTAVPMVALLAAMGSAGVPVVLLRRRIAQQSQARQDSWPDAVDQLASAVRAGLALPEAVGDLARRGPVALRLSFREFDVEYRATGSFTRALDALQDALADPVADRVCASLRIARDVGGSDLGHVLRTLSALLREDLRTRGEIAARQSWTVNAARISVAAPWLTLALLCTRPEAVAAFTSWMGTLVLAGSAVVSFLAYRLMRQLGKLPTPERVIA